MTSNKALATLFVITLNMQRAASSSSSTQGSSSSGELVSRPRHPASVPAPRRTIPMSVDGPTTRKVEPVEVMGGESIEEASQMQKLVVPLKYDVHGKIIVDKEAIVKSGVYYKKNYVVGGALETALLQAFKWDDCDRFIDLLKFRKEVTAEKDEQDQQKGHRTSFERFTSEFTAYLAPEKDNAALRQFLTLHGDELRKKYPYFLDVFCEGLVSHLAYHLDKPGAKNLLADMVGQPSILTPVSFARGFLADAFSEGDYSAFIKHAWGGAILAGLSIPNRGEQLVRVLKSKYPTRFSGSLPPTESEREAILGLFPTKKKLEEDWTEMNAKTRFEMLKRLGFTPELTPTTFPKSDSLKPASST